MDPKTEEKLEREKQFHRIRDLRGLNPLPMGMRRDEKQVCGSPEWNEVSALVIIMSLVICTVL